MQGRLFHMIIIKGEGKGTAAGTALLFVIAFELTVKTETEEDHHTRKDEPGACCGTGG